MKTLGLLWIFSWLLGSTIGRLVLLAVVLWYLDNRYFGLLAALWAPVARARHISNLRRATEINLSDVRSMVELGEHYVRAGKFKAAAEYLQRAAERGEDGARALYLHGAALVRLGQHAEGRAKLEAAVAKNHDVAYGEPYLYLLEEALATEGPQAPRVEELVAELDRFDSVEVLTRAGRLCAGAGRKDLARRLLEEAVRNYGFTPKAMRRRERRWALRARVALLRL